MSAEGRRAEFVSTRSLLEKLGVRSGAKVLLVDVPDVGFRAELEAAEAEVHDAETGTDFDAIFFRVGVPEHLARLIELRQLLKSNGSVWLLRRKGKGRTVSQEEAMAAGKEAGLVDVKVVNFSDDETAEKFVIPLKDR